jgi:hypothetical protein
VLVLVLVVVVVLVEEERGSGLFSLPSSSSILPLALG